MTSAPETAADDEALVVLSSRAADFDPVGGRYGWWAVGVLTAAHLVSFIDRFVMSLLLTPIRAQMRLSDTQLGLIQSFSFVLLYSIAGIPLGRLADTADRRRLIAMGLGVWSLATAACAFADSFGELFAARVMVGFGEAALVPAAMSMIAGYMPRAKLTRAVSLFTMGSPLGKVVALIGGAWLLASLIPHAGLDLGGRHFHPWQVLFLIAALPGLALIPTVLSLSEPQRATAPQGSNGFSTALAHMARHAPAYGVQIAAACLAIILVQSFGAWAPTFFARVHHLSIPQTGYLVGAVTLVASPLGNLFGGWATDALVRRGIRAAPLTVIGASLFMAIPTVLLLASAPTTATAAVAFGLLTFLLSTTAGPCLAGVQMLTPIHQRGAATAVYMCVMTLVSVGVGPTLVGVISDVVFGAGAGLGDALTASTIGVAVLGVALVAVGRRVFPKANADFHG
jgi:MFS family permease